MESGYKVQDIFSMKLKDIKLLNEMFDEESNEELSEDFLDLLM